MLELKPTCENCDRELPYNSTEAMICSFECSFCKSCVEDVLKNVCPNCGGGFTQRPVRPAKFLEKHPPSTIRVFKPVDLSKHEISLQKFEHVKPENR